MFKTFIEKIRAADIVKKYIYANVITYIILLLIGVFSVLLNQRAEVGEWVELPASLSQLLQRPWTVFTYMFVHGSLWHILWNMLALHVFGRIYLELFSTRHFIGTYLLSCFFYIVLIKDVFNPI